MTKLFHSDIFIPAALRARAEKIKFERLQWSRHAQLELVRDLYGIIPTEAIPRTFNAVNWSLIELEAEGDIITKSVFRRTVDATRSLVIVLRFDGWSTATVCTCWTNLNTDKHATLDRSKYATS